MKTYEHFKEVEMLELENKRMNDVILSYQYKVEELTKQDINDSFIVKGYDKLVEQLEEEISRLKENNSAYQYLVESMSERIVRLERGINKLEMM